MKVVLGRKPTSEDHNRLRSFVRAIPLSDSDYKLQSNDDVYELRRHLTLGHLSANVRASWSWSELLGKCAEHRHTLLEAETGFFDLLVLSLCYVARKSGASDEVDFELSATVLSSNERPNEKTIAQRLNAIPIGISVLNVLSRGIFSRAWELPYEGVSFSQDKSIYHTLTACSQVLDALHEAEPKYTGQTSGIDAS